MERGADAVGCVEMISAALARIRAAWNSLIGSEELGPLLAFGLR